MPVGGRIFHITSDYPEGQGDKFFVYNDDAFTDFVEWSLASSGTAIGLSQDVGIGQGKANNQAFFNAGFSDGCFQWAKNLTTGGCSDWYVPTCGEQAALFGGLQTGLIIDFVASSWMFGYDLWTSVESVDEPSDNGVLWDPFFGMWVLKGKYDGCRCFAIRSF